jgi:CRISPR-associated protein Cas6
MLEDGHLTVGNALPTRVLVQMQWRVGGNRLPLDHCYHLYSALVERQPVLKEIDWQLDTVNGKREPADFIKLGYQSRLLIRCNVEHLSLFDLDGQILRVGQTWVQLGQGEGSPRLLLAPQQSLRANLVTIKSNYLCGISEFEFGIALGKQLANLGINTMPILGNRRTLKIKGKIVVGYGVRFDDLPPEESLILQQHGIGGRRKMGCGVFVAC